MWANDRRVLTAQGSPRSTVIPAVGGSVYSMCLSDKYLIAGTYEHLIQIWVIRSGYGTMGRINMLQH